MIEALGWIAIVLVYLVVHFFSKGQVKIGNTLQILAALAWGIVAFHTALWSLFFLNFLLAGRSAYMLWKDRNA